MIHHRLESILISMDIILLLYEYKCEWVIACKKQKKFSKIKLTLVCSFGFSSGTLSRGVKTRIPARIGWKTRSHDM